MAETKIEIETAYCMRCISEDMPTGHLCKRSVVIDNGPEARDNGLCRYEGICLRCCNHNHG